MFLADCPARTTLRLVTDTWSVVAVFALGERPRRYAELQERIGGISNAGDGHEHRAAFKQAVKQGRNVSEKNDRVATKLGAPACAS